MNGNRTTTSNGSYQLRSKTPTTDRMLFPNGNQNDYLYLNGSKPGVDQLYSTVSTRSTNKLLDQIDNGVNTMVISQRPQPNHHQHVPIYDATTNIQHQRVINGMKPMPPGNNISRSKTPGPDTIYFRNDMGYSNGGMNGNEY